MAWLNYHHLLYFWTVARTGGVGRAAAELHLSQPTISAQVKALEGAIGAPLFTRVGRSLVLTDVGRMAFQYADEIFSAGRELQDALEGRRSGRPLRLTVGVADALSKLIAYRLLAPALAIPEPVQIACHEGSPDTLLAQLAIHGLDAVLSDAPVPPTVRVRAFGHLLGECGVTIFAAPPLARRLKRGFPGSLRDAPCLLPSETTTLRRGVDQWLTSRGLQPRVAGEFDDAALMMAFGEAGVGAFPAASAIEREVCRQYGVRVVGRIAEVRERFYVITVERRLKHPAIAALSAAARADLFTEE